MNYMIFLWSGVSILGMLVAIWYFGAILDPRGRINYPMILWYSTGHLISWLLMSIGVFSIFQLYTTTGNIELFLKIMTVIITLSLVIKSIFTPLAMPYIDQEGELFSRRGLRFGGVTTQHFIDATEPLSQKMDGIEIRIIGEAHYLITWLHSFPEIAFLISMVYFGSIWAALLIFTAAYIIEFMRLYLFGSSIFISGISRIWSWGKIPAFVILLTYFWHHDKSVSITLIIFLVVQGWFSLLSVVGLLPFRLLAGRLIFLKFGAPWHNTEAIALKYVINRWRLKLFPTDRFDTGGE